MDGWPRTGGSNQGQGSGGNHEGGPDVRRSSDELDTPDAELLALMRDSERYLRLTEPRNDNNNNNNNENRSTGTESRSPPPLPSPAGPTPASTAAPTPAGTPPTLKQGQRRSLGTVSLFPRVRPSPPVPPGRLLTQEELYAYWKTAPRPVTDPLSPPTAPPNDNNVPKSPNPTTSPGLGGISAPMTLSFRPTPEKSATVEQQQGQQPKQKVSTPPSHKRNKSHGDHINSAVHTRLPASPSPRPRPKSEWVSIPTPTRPPFPLPTEAPVKSPGSTISTNKTPTRVINPSFRRLVGKISPSSGAENSPVPGPSPSTSRPPPATIDAGELGSDSGDGILFKDAKTGLVVAWQSWKEDAQDADVQETKEIAGGVEKSLSGIKETLRRIRMENAEVGEGRGGEEDGKGKGKEICKGKAEEKDDGDDKDEKRDEGGS
ncbi:hypothetical protein QBC36DRAFT_182644 [Triangularia setosa]|uniref:Uncharacterized protein n=1 Tax=Triangularia setosa TaxID=2587417 RepID=A0AAN6WAK4_9PEZI|nr:hypothetical protein QBC36DRAFT_182644 [Podospora setosa]